MPRNSAGVYTLPAGNPVVTNTVITPVWANPTMSDIAQELTNSLDRQGRGGMLAPFKFLDGTIAAPGITWINEPTSGWYRAGLSDFRFTVGGVDKIAVTGAGVTINGPLGTTGIISAGGFNATGTALPGNGMYLPAINTLGLVTNGTERLRINDVGAVVIGMAVGAATSLLVSGRIAINGDAAANNSEIQITNTGIGGHSWRIGDGIGIGNGRLAVYDNTSAKLRFSVGASGFSINAPDAGTALTINQLDGANAIVISNSPSAAAATLNIAWNLLLGAAWDIFTQGADNLHLGAAGVADVRLFTNSTERIRVGSAGNITIFGANAGNTIALNAPTGGGVALFTTGTGPVPTQIIVQNASNASYSSLRLFNDTNNSGRSLEIDYAGSAYVGPLLNNTPGGEGAAIATTANYFLALGTGNTARIVITGAGAVNYYPPSGGNANGIEIGFRDLARTDIGGTITLAENLRGAAVRYVGGAGQTMFVPGTMPPNSIITIVNDGTAPVAIAGNGGMQMYWMNGSGAPPVANRTLAVGGVCTIWVLAASLSMVWGIGLS